MIYPSTAPWDGLESLVGVRHVVSIEQKKQGFLVNALWWCWEILSTYLGRRE